MQNTRKQYLLESVICWKNLFDGIVYQKQRAERGKRWDLLLLQSLVDLFFLLFHQQETDEADYNINQDCGNQNGKHICNGANIAIEQCCAHSDGHTAKEVQADGQGKRHVQMLIVQDH